MNVIVRPVQIFKRSWSRSPLHYFLLCPHVTLFLVACTALDSQNNY